MIRITTPDTNALISQMRNDIREALGNTDTFVTIGIHEDKNARNQEGGTQRLTNAQIGAANHFGTSRIPARPFLDVGVRRGDLKYIQIIEDTAKNNEPLELALERCGIVAAGEVQRYIDELRTPPNAESTVKKKGSANPLIDTGQMRQSISYKLTPNRPDEGL